MLVILNNYLTPVNFFNEHLTRIKKRKTPILEAID